MDWCQGVARAWSQLEDTRAQLTVLQQQIEMDRFSNSHRPQQPLQQVAASAEAAAQIRLLSEHLHAAKAAVQAAERQADKFRQEGEIAMTEVAKQRAKLQVLAGAHEHEQRVRAHQPIGSISTVSGTLSLNGNTCLAGSSSCRGTAGAVAANP